MEENKENTVQNESTPPKGKRGGARPGAGRKKTVARHISFGIPQDVADILETQPKKAAFICEAVRHYARMISEEQGAKAGASE